MASCKFCKTKISNTGRQGLICKACKQLIELSRKRERCPTCWGKGFLIKQLTNKEAEECKKQQTRRY